jgi:hypothetical protein
LNIFLILHLIALQVSILLTLVVFLRRPPKQLWPSLAVVPIGGAIWSLGELLAQFFPFSDIVYELWVCILYTGTIVLTISWLHFILSFAKYVNFELSFDSQRFRNTTIIISLMAWLVIMTNPVHGMFITTNMLVRNDY